MACKKMKTHARILDFIEIVNSELFDVIHCTASEYMFSTRGKPGNTFLIPTKETIDEIHSLAYSIDTNDVYKAGDIIASHIITLNLKKPSDFSNMKDDISNRLDQSIPLNKVSGKEIHFKNGSIATLNDKFKDSSRGQKLSVYTMTKGKIGVDNPPTKHTYDKKVKKGKNVKGSYVKPNIVGGSSRREFLSLVENRYASMLPKNIFLQSTVGFLSFLIDTKNMDTFKNIIPLVHFNPDDIYRWCKEQYVDNSVMSEWMKVCDNYMGNANNHLQKVLSAYDAEVSKQIPDRVGMHNTFKKCVNDGIKSDNIRPRKYPTYIKKCIESMCNGTHKHPAANKCTINQITKNMENLYLSHQIFNEMDKYPFNNELFMDVLELLKDPHYRLINGDTLKCYIFPQQRVFEIKQFVNSSAFGFIPFTIKDINTLSGSSVKPEPTHSGETPTFYNLHAYNRSILSKKV